MQKHICTHKLSRNETKRKLYLHKIITQVMPHA